MWKNDRIPSLRTRSSDDNHRHSPFLYLILSLSHLLLPCHKGFVTDHVFLLQEQSKLYHYLAGFESDSKRKIAMEARRIEILLPLLNTLNRTAFEALHKQVCTLLLHFVRVLCSTVTICMHAESEHCVLSGRGYQRSSDQFVFYI